MTKKDYVAIAQWLRRHDIPRLLKRDRDIHALDNLIEILKLNNPKFDERRFRKYIWAEIDTEGLLLD